MNNAELAAALSPLEPDCCEVLPAKVVMMPVDDTTRMLLLTISAMYTLPSADGKTPAGYQKLADVAGPPSPTLPMPTFPSPAMVVIMLLVSTLRTRKFSQSLKYKLLLESCLITVG